MNEEVDELEDDFKAGFEEEVSEDFEEEEEEEEIDELEEEDDGEVDEELEESEETPSAIAERIQARKDAERKYREEELKAQREAEMAEERNSVIGLDASREILSNIGLEDIPDVSFDIDGESMSMKDIAEENPAMFEAMKYFATAVSTKQTKSTEMDLGRQVASLNYWSDVSGVHPSAKKIIGSEEFGNWFESQPEEVQALSDSGYSDDAIALLDDFEASKGRSKKVNKETVIEKPSIRPSIKKRGTRKVIRKRAKIDKDDYSAGFNSVT